METKTASFTDLVQPALEQVERRMRASPEAHHPQLNAALEHLLASGGKRIRPTLVLLVGGQLGANPEQLITLAAAIELLHTATLVHDDLIDGASLRRGIPTLNATWDGGSTVLTGDYIFARAAYLAAQTRSLPIMESFARTLMVIVNGELTQLFRSGSGDLRRDYYARVNAKTASLFQLAAEGAAILADMPEETRARARSGGSDLGTAFQIVDDVLDFVGQASEVGKPVASDLRHGLITLPTLCFLEAHPQEDSALRRLLGGELGQAEIERLIARIRQFGAVEMALQEAESYVRRGAALLDSLPTDGRDFRAALDGLARYIIQRTS
jgi:geranylgeranyl pyrophosphate synthase